jgi:hypothetical protein
VIVHAAHNLRPFIGALAVKTFNKMDKTKMQSIGITQTFSQDVTRQLIRLSGKRGVTVQELVRMFVANGLESLETKQINPKP